MGYIVWLYDINDC